MNVWAVANQKGGVGKTTTVVSCAGLLAEEGKRVLAVDLDPQGSLTSYFRHEPEQLRLSTFDLFSRPRLPEPALIDRMTLATTMPNLKLLPACSALATVERDCRAADGIGLRVSRLVDRLADQYDHVLIDSPPVLGVLMINALAACHRLIVPVQTDYLAIRGLDRMVATLAMVTRARGMSLSYSILPTMFETNCEVSVKSLRTIIQQFGEHAEDVVIPRDNTFRDASMRGILPSTADPDSRGVKAYRTLLRHAGLIVDSNPEWYAGVA